MFQNEILDYKEVSVLRSHQTMQKLETWNSQEEGLSASLECGKGRGRDKRQGSGMSKGRSKVRVKKGECFKFH